MQIGFIGAGLMGGPLARNLIRAGKSVLLFDLNKDCSRAKQDMTDVEFCL